MTADPVRLQRLRHSHCDTCGCKRCTRIDNQLQQHNIISGHPDGDDSWLVEGTLVRNKGLWYLQVDGETQSLASLLTPWEGHEVLLLIGKAQEI